jgi:glyoxylase-like metal-dependent hydrolase (beta-lactamase superfamily II)
MLRIVRVLAPNPSVYTLEGTNTWIVGDDPSIVIDPGPDDAGHLDEIARAAGRVAAVLVTHDHEDHAPGAPAFAERVGAPLHAFRLKGAEHLRDGQRFLASGGAEVVAEYTPGHSSDHVAFFVPSEEALFTGDAVVGRGTSFIDPPDGDLVQYLRSLHRMRDLNPRVIYPGHGPIVLDARATLDEYVAHREDRERQVLELLGSGPRTTTDLVATIYTDYPSDVHVLAERSVLAHLLKLESEGRAERKGKSDGATWTISEPRACSRCGRPVKGRARLCGSCSLAVLQDTADTGG